jgi:serine/threonine protein phosphatase 1
MTDRIIAIGDVHGCAKALATLLIAVQPTQQDTLVFLGDYIDRGPDSRGVVEQVIALRGYPGRYLLTEAQPVRSL